MKRIFQRIVVFLIDLVFCLLFFAIFQIASLSGMIVFFVFYKVISILEPGIRVIEKGDWPLIIGLSGYFICLGMLIYFDSKKWRLTSRFFKFIHARLRKTNN